MTREEAIKILQDYPNCTVGQLSKVPVKAVLEFMEAIPHWISVEDELPEFTIDGWRSENVFFATDDGKSHFGFYNNKGVWFSSVYVFNGHQVTHWMPLPEAPRNDDHDRQVP